MLRNRVIGYALTVAMGAVLIGTMPRVVRAAEPEVTTNSIGMKLVTIPAGEFLMGVKEDRPDTLNKFPYCDPKWLDGELPRHKVRITKAFEMGQHEVTLNHFLKFYHAANYKKVEIERDGKPSWGYENGKLVESNRYRPWAPLAWRPEMDHPVIYVSWNDAVAFCEWLSKKEGKTYVSAADGSGMGIRLPGGEQQPLSLRRRSRGTDSVRECGGYGLQDNYSQRDHCIVLQSRKENGHRNPISVSLPPRRVRVDGPGGQVSAECVWIV